MKRIQIATIIMFVAGAVACGGKDKGGGDKGSAAKDSGQKSGSKAKGSSDQASSEGDTYEGVTCDDSTDGLAWCDSDTEIAFCSDGEWFVLDCTAIDTDFCADDGDTIDCYVDG